MRYVFFALLAANVGLFGYYHFLHKLPVDTSVAAAKATLTNPVTVTNVSDELPPMIGTKK